MVQDVEQTHWYTTVGISGELCMPYAPSAPLLTMGFYAWESLRTDQRKRLVTSK